MRKFVKIGAGIAFVAIAGVNYLTLRQRDSQPARSAAPAVVVPTPAPVSPVRSEPGKPQPSPVAVAPVAAPRAEPEATIPSEQLAPRVDPAFNDAQLRARSPMSRPFSRPD